MEDAVELGQFLSQSGLLPQSLRDYEASRIPRVQQVMACEMVCCFLTVPEHHLWAANLRYLSMQCLSMLYDAYTLVMLNLISA